MNSLPKFLKRNKPLFLIILLAIISSWRWLSFDIFAHGDYQFQYSETLKDLFSLATSWVSSSGLGQVNITASNWPFLAVSGIFGLMGYDSNIADKFIFFFPIILLPGITSYYLIKKIVNSQQASVIGSIVFSYNAYLSFLKTEHLLILVAFCLAPLLILLFIKTLEEKRTILLILTILVAFIISQYEFRIFYITSFVLAFYFAFHILFIEKVRKQTLLKNFIHGASALLIILFLNLYWLIGLLKTGSVLHNSLFDRDLFGSQFLNLPEAITLFHPFWNGSEPVSFIVNPIPTYFWLIPLIAFLGLMLNRKDKKVLFFGLIALFGILLTKQEDVPLSNLYLWLYQNVPGFNAFREASKFYFLIAVGYSVLTGALVRRILEYNNKGRILKVVKIAIPALIAALFLWNTIPFITGKIGTLFVPRTIPGDYLILKNLITGQPDYFRTYWAPTSAKWSIYNDQHPKINGVDIHQGDWKDLVTSAQNPQALPENTQITNILAKPYTTNLLNNSSTKYLIVPLRDQTNNDDFFISYGDDRQYYIDTLSSLPFLKKIDIGTKDLAVYENPTYKPYITSLTNLYTLSNVGQLDLSYTFARNTLKEPDFNFMLADPTKTPRAISLTDPFSNFGQTDLQSGVIAKNLTLPSDQTTQLYTNSNHSQISYLINKGSLTVTALNSNYLELDGKTLTSSTNIQNTVLNQKLTRSKSYYLAVGTNLQQIHQDITDNRLLGFVDQPLKLYSVSGPNLIPNPSLEKGLWQQQVQDCNNYDNRALISMKIDNQNATLGQNSLELDADQHTSCTGPGPIAVKSGSQYMFRFDYQVDGTKVAGYQITFDDPKKTVLKEQLLSDTNWRTLAKVITPPAGATHLTFLVMGFPDDQKKQHAKSNYDNFQLSELHLEAPINVDPTPNFTKISTSTTPSLKYADPAFSYQNLIKNPSLEDGLWQKSVGDCNNYDSNPSIGMTLDQVDRTNGRQSLELQAKRHIACTGPDSVPVKENTNYRFSFDYQSPNATQAGYYIAFDDPAHTVISETLPIKNTSWNTFTKYIKSPASATSMSISVYSYPNDYGTENIKTRYDNFSFIEIPDIQGRYLLVSRPTEQLQQPASVTFDSANPTLKYVHVTSAKTPFYLAMSEAYHDQWRLELNNSSVNGRLRGWIPWVYPNAVSDSSHVKLNDFENGWYVDPAILCGNNPQGCVRNADGSYNLQMQIEFVPQRWFYLGTLISGITLAACLSYLGYYLVRKLIKRNQRS